MSDSLCSLRALDAEIAEALFGYAWEPVHPDDIVGRDVTHVLHGDWRGDPGGVQSCHRIAEKRADGSIVYFQNAPYSTDYTAVRLVFDEINRRGLGEDFALHLSIELTLEAPMGLTSRDLWDVIRATPEQISRAALSVVRASRG